MMPNMRREVEILLDLPDQRDFVVSAYADMSVQDGFARQVERHLRNQIKEAEASLSAAEAGKHLDADMEVIRQAVQDLGDTAPARGLAVFSSVARGLRKVIPLDFPVENRLVIDEEPFVLPLLEAWHTEPTFLIAVVDSDEAHIFESHAGVPEPVGDMLREDADEAIQRDKPRFIYKKRFAQTRHERLRGAEEDKFLQDVADSLWKHWQGNGFAGLILLGQSQITSPLRRLLHKDLQNAVVEEASQAMTTKTADVADDVARVMERWHAERDQEILAELTSRWKEGHLVANGPTDVLDALQQGRATRVVVGTRRDLAGARCPDCGYRFGAPSQQCVYCGGRCRSLNAVQEILRMALRHRVPVHMFRRDRGLETDPLAPAGGVAALLRAEANWAPDQEKARTSEGH